LGNDISQCPAQGGRGIALVAVEMSRMQPDPGAQIGDWVSFRIADVFLPEPAELLASLTEDLEANGEIVQFSDSGESPRAYVVVRITPRQVVLLPVEALRVVNFGRTAK
jgi:hypothetical protein